MQFLSAHIVSCGLLTEKSTGSKNAIKKNVFVYKSQISLQLEKKLFTFSKFLMFDNITGFPTSWAGYHSSVYFPTIWLLKEGSTLN